MKRRGAPERELADLVGYISRVVRQIPVRTGLVRIGVVGWAVGGRGEDSVLVEDEHPQPVGEVEESGLGGVVAGPPRVAAHPSHLLDP